ncbi:MAG: hypothetical protein BGP04_15650 [Rhizobiales bacterium 62-17]|nr:hypothetical protein [Hyphomicrobiales bacterium]OJY03204.1 MAG: hypothetical protein BGP04_15650 [Rhizobiales bacterium 62-17]
MRDISRTIRKTAAAATLFASALLLPGAAALAQNKIVLENHVFDNGDAGKITFHSIELTDSNLDRDDVLKLFSATTPAEEATALAARLSASRLLIPALTFTAKTLQGTVKDIEATDIVAGTIKRYTTSQYQSTFIGDDGKEEAKIAASEAENGSVTALIRMLRNFDPLTDTSAYTHLAFREFEFGFEDKDLAPYTSPGGMVWFRMDRLANTITYGDTLLRRSTLQIDKLTLDLPGLMRELSNEFGIDPSLAAFVTLEGDYDPASKTITSKFTLRANDHITLSIAGRLVDVEPNAMTSPPYRSRPELLSAAIRDADISLIDNGAIAKLLASWAQTEGSSPAKATREAVREAQTSVTDLFGRNAGSRQLSKGIGDFIRKPGHLKIVAAAKRDPLKLADLIDEDTTKFLEKFNLKVVLQGRSSSEPSRAMDGRTRRDR